ncbi:MAG: hypothetical protein IKL27_01385 [Oscillospiraceae bacterium]|nr:hypothetical protein [Oscillospiraceae bacterium]
MSVFFNSASLILGLAAWAFAIAAIIKNDKRCHSFISFTACNLSLVFQILEIHNRVNLGDFSAIMDTIGAVVLASVVMSSVTIIINLAALFRAGAKNK